MANISQENEIEQKPEDTNRLKVFATETSAHGIRNVVSPGRSIFSRFVWTVGVLMAAIVLIMTLYNLNNNYRDYNFITNIKVQPTKEMPFPAVTVCNRGFINGTRLKEMFIYDEMKILLLQNGIYKNYLSPVNTSIPPFSNVSAMKIDTLLKQVSYNLDASLIACTWNGEWKPCRDLFTIVETFIGRCFTFNSNTSSRLMTKQEGSTSGLWVVVNIHQQGYMITSDLSAGYKVLLHEPHEFPDLISKGFVLSPGQSYSIAIKKTDFDYLASPYKAFGDEACTDTDSPDFNMSLNYSSIYSQSACLIECLIARISEICQCKTMENPESAYPYCTWGVYIDCIWRNGDSIYMDSRANDTCGCPIPCKSSHYDTHLSSMYYPSNVAMDLLTSLRIHTGTHDEIRSNYLELRIFYEELMINEIKHVPEYTLNSILGTVGGQMGLLLGASILTVAEFGEFMITIIIVGCRRLWKKIRDIICRKRKGHVIDVLPTK